MPCRLSCSCSHRSATQKPKTPACDRQLSRWSCSVLVQGHRWICSATGPARWWKLAAKDFSSIVGVTQHSGWQQYGIRLGGVSKVFVTHLHSDHVIGIPDLFLTPWASEEARKVPFEVWGPPGTREMMDHMQKAFAFDIRIRRDVDEKYSKEGITVSSHDIKEGAVFEKNGVMVTAFLVDHGPVKPAFGYRIDYGGHSVALSGDTRFSENLIKFSQGVDVIIHEAVDAEALCTSPGNRTRKQMENIIAHHTTLQQAGDVFSRIKPRLAVYSHKLGNSNDPIRGTRNTYSSPLEGGEDLMTIEIGEKIEVRRFKQ